MTATKNSGGVTLAQVRKWPAVVDVSQAATALGISRSSLYAAIAEGAAPVQVIRVRRRQKVLTSSLVELLEGGRTAASA
jgi:K+-transporting ATPase c subunit